jgi:hypothetical protein
VQTLGWRALIAAVVVALAVACVSLLAISWLSAGSSF